MKRRQYFEPLFTTQPTTTNEQHPYEVHCKRNGVTIITAHWTATAAAQERDWQKRQGVTAEVVRRG